MATDPTRPCARMETPFTNDLLRLLVTGEPAPALTSTAPRDVTMSGLRERFMEYERAKAIRALERVVFANKKKS